MTVGAYLQMGKNDECKLDRILIKDLLLRCIIGVNESERKERQDVLINVVIWADLSEAAEADDIHRTVDYKEVNKAIIKLVEDSKFYLIETLAEKVAQLCLQHERAAKVKVAVEKPGALRFTRSVGVEIVRKRS
jgi:FolB domain-containing protein